MGYIKPPSRAKVTVEDLLNALDAPEEPKQVETSTENNSSVLSYIMAYKVVPGDYPVTSKLLYELYRCWAKNPVSRKSFSLELGSYIVRQGHYYYIDRPALKVSEEVERYVAKSTRSATKVKSYKKHFENYLKKYSIKPGTYYIETFILYYLYDKWCYGIKKKRPLGQNQFSELCRLYFKTKRNSKSRIQWFGICKEDLFKVITFSQIVNIRKGRRKRYARPKKQPKKPQEVSSHRSQDEFKD